MTLKFCSQRGSLAETSDIKVLFPRQGQHKNATKPAQQEAAKYGHLEKMRYIDAKGLLAVSFKGEFPKKSGCREAINTDDFGK